MSKRLLPLVPLPSPSAPPPGQSADVALSGQPLPALDRIKLFSDKQWETFVLEWADSLREQYKRVEWGSFSRGPCRRVGGATGGAGPRDGS